MNIERKWMVLKLDTDGVVIVESHLNERYIRTLCAYLSEEKQTNDYAVKYGYPWEA